HAHFNVVPERALEGTVDLLERHVALAVAPLPVAAHLAPRVADERAVEDEDRRIDRFEARHIGVDQVPGCAQRRLHQVLRGVSFCFLSVVFARFSGHRKAPFIPPLFPRLLGVCGTSPPAVSWAFHCSCFSPTSSSRTPGLAMTRTSRFARC